MKYIKTFEKITKFTDDLNLGFKLHEGMLGVLINHEEWADMDMLLTFLQKDKGIKFRLLITNRIVLLLFPDKDDVKKLPKDNLEYRTDITDHYVPLISNWNNRSVGWFYQDIIEEDNWEEVIIENENDIRELEEKMKMYYEAKKYNI